MLNVDDIMREQGQMESARSGFDTLWQQAAELMFPRQADFVGVSSTNSLFQGQRRTDKILDEYAELALEHGVAVFEGEVIPQGSIWQRLIPRDDKLLQSQRVRVWYENLTNKLFALRNAYYSGFANQSHESACSLLAFGNQGTWVDTLIDRRTGRKLGLGYRSEHIGQLYIRENYWGVVDKVHRKFSLSHRQALQKWPDDPPECAAKAQRDRTNMETKAEYLHVLCPNTDYEAGRLDAKGKPIASAYVELSCRELFDTGGYRTMPLIYSRYEKAPTEEYGRGPGLTVLPAVMALQEMMADIMTATEFMARPALGAVEDMKDQVFFYEPGGVSFGAIDPRGNRLVAPILDNVDLAQPLVLQERTRQIVDRAFFADLYSVRDDEKTHVSATAVMDRAQQRGVLLAPLARQQPEWFTPMAERELDLAFEMGMLDDMPPEVREAGGLYQIVYENPLTRARQAEQAGGFYQMLNGVAPMMQADPTLYADFKRNYSFERVLKGLAFIHAVPSSWETSDEEKQQIDQATAAKAQAATLLDVGQQASEIAKNMGQATGYANAA
jgi:hypothetical protein